jgi:hypothetical protein
MNNNYNFSDFAGLSLTANNELDHYGSQKQSRQVSIDSQESPAEKRIDNMLLSHNKYHVYCE